MKTIENYFVIVNDCNRFWSRQWEWWYDDILSASRYDNIEDAQETLKDLNTFVKQAKVATVNFSIEIIE